MGTFPAFSHRASTAALAISLRFSGVNALARASPPLEAPNADSALAPSTASLSPLMYRTSVRKLYLPVQEVKHYLATCLSKYVTGMLAWFALLNSLPSPGPTDRAAATG